LPAEFIADRIFVHPVMADGRRLSFYTDSGGGKQFMYADSVKRLGLATEQAEVGTEKATLTPIPAWREGAGIPAPLAIHQPDALRTKYFVFPSEGHSDVGAEDGFLGHGWFGGRVWTFDYPSKQLLLRADGDVPQHTPDQEVPLHFPLGNDGYPLVHFARMTIEVDGEALDLLFDTGAMLELSPEGSQVFGKEPKIVATSFIVKSVFERWQKRHPDWRVVDRAEEKRGSAVIEVPKIRVAKQDVGPVWFTRRKDADFHEFMSSMMDGQVEGALGGSGLRYFRVTVDYPRRFAVFQRP
jgi:hypothetical protein